MTGKPVRRRRDRRFTAFRHVAASILEPSAEIHSLWGVLHPAREARARLMGRLD
jgi:hypothetical protein